MKKLSSIFNIRYGHSLELNRLARANPGEGYPFVSRKTGDNGIAAYIKAIPGVSPNPAGELTCALSGNGILSTFIQDRPYYTAFHVACLIPTVELTIAQKLYYCFCIRANRYRYGWGRQANRSLKDILLPSVAEIPAWVEDAAAIAFGGADKPAKVSEEVIELDAENWRVFKLADLFTLKKGKRLTKENMRPGATPFIGAVAVNNGITSLVAQEASHTGNTITVNYNGSVAEAFFQPVPYRCSDDVNVLYPKFAMTPHVALFIAAVIRNEKYRFNFGRKWHLERMAESPISLPALADGSLDLEFMERFISSLPFSSQV